MDRYQINSFANSKVPSYVPIYDKLYSDILNGVYQPGSRLPGETYLAEKYDVSRNTVRQALTVLVEDGLVEKKQGKGTFVTYDANREAVAQGLYNPMIVCSRNKIEKIDIYYNFGPATEIGQRKLGLRPSEIVLAGNNVYHGGGKPVGHSFMQIPVKYIDGLNVDLNDEEDVKDLLNRQIFEMSDTVQLAVKIVYAEDYITAYLKVPKETALIFIEEIFYDKEKNAVARCKFYFIPDEYDIVFKEGGAAAKADE